MGNLASAHLMVWLASEGSRDESRAAGTRCTGQSGPFLVVCAILSGRQVQAPPVMLEQLGLYRLLLEGKFAEALPGLKRRYEQTPPGSDTMARLLYAWALVETGRAADAGPLLAQYPVVMPGRRSDLYAGGVSAVPAPAGGGAPGTGQDRRRRCGRGAVPETHGRCGLIQTSGLSDVGVRAPEQPGSHSSRCRAGAVPAGRWNGAATGMARLRPRKPLMRPVTFWGPPRVRKTSPGRLDSTFGGRWTKTG